MPQPSVWDQGLWDEARWSYVTADGTITEGPDVALGGIAVIDQVGGLITEAPDVAAGAITANQGVSGDVTEGHDVASGGIVALSLLSGDITEGADEAVGDVGILIGVSGVAIEGKDVTFCLIEPGPDAIYADILEGADQASGEIRTIVRLSGSIKENRDKVRGNIFGPPGAKRRGGGWAPQFHYKRDWEIEVEAVIEPEPVIDLSLEPDPYFIPQALPMDPAVARILETIMQGPQAVDTDEEDLEAILMNL